VIVVEHKDRLTRFGFNSIKPLLAMQGRSLKVVNVTENPIEDLIVDFVSSCTAFAHGLTGNVVPSAM
jgi:predicted site-specific integrase-resolvase